MSFKNRIYKTMETPHTAMELYEFTNLRGIEVSWIVEAGCHDAGDTERLSALFNTSTIYAFEPDPVAFEKAKYRIEKLNSKGLSIKLSNIALMDATGDGRLTFVGEPGDGSTQIQNIDINNHDYRVQVSKFDDLVIPEKSNGLLWLDVEGNAVSALKGMKASLQKFNVAKIEVEFHDTSQSRLGNYREVIALMKRANFRIVKSDNQPGFFGDMLFVNSSQINFIRSFESYLITLVTHLLHGFIYPILKKPRKINA